MNTAERIVRGVLMAVGFLVLAAAIAILLLIGTAKLEYLIANPPLRHGTVTSFGYDDGHTWYSDWVFGRYTFRKAYGDGKEHFYVFVADGKGHEDCWEISREDQYILEIGQEISRSQFQ